jgi:hypothetical protein
MAEMIKRMNQHLAEANHVGRTRDVVAGFFDGLDLLEPGVVKVTQWRPASDVEAGGPTSMWGGVGGGADGRLELVHRFRGGCGYLFTPFPHRCRDGLPGRVELLARIVRLTNHGRIISSRASSGQGRPRSGQIRPLSPPSGVHIGPSVSSSW